MTSHNRKWKEAKKDVVSKLAKEYPYIAIATLDQLPANILSILRKKLQGSAVIIVAKTRVLQKALAESKVDTTALNPFVSKSIAIIFSKKNPFELYSFVKKNKGSAAAKENDLADSDLLVQAGDTGLPPGPALSTLKAAGLKVKVAGATIAISEDKVVAKKGEKISKEVAEVLGKLNIKPMKIGMKILAVLDKDGKEFFTGAALDVDEEELFEKFVLAYQQMLNLAVNSEYFNDKSAEVLIMKAAMEGKAIKAAVDAASPASAPAAEVAPTPAAEVAPAPSQ